LIDSASFLRGGDIPQYKGEIGSPRLSLTSDVLNHRKCQRKYGLYKVRGFEASAPTAEFVGTFAHRSMEKAWHEAREGKPPDQTRMIAIMESIVNQLMYEEKRKPHSKGGVLKAGWQVMRMHATLLHRGLYDGLVDMERRLRYSHDDYVLEGVIDAIFDSDKSVMLWDWKAANDPRRALNSDTTNERSWNYNQRVMADYSLQLRVYHYLYERAVGRAPDECRIVFLGEIPVKHPPLKKRNLTEAWTDMDAGPLSDAEWDVFEAGSADPSSPGLFYTVSNESNEIGAAMKEFHEEAKRILAARKVDEWCAPEQDCLPDRQTCLDCDFRESCPALASHSSS
jgi:hypothetical protein